MKKSGESMLLILINRLALIVLYDGVLIFRDRALLLGARPGLQGPVQEPLARNSYRIPITYFTVVLPV